MSSTLTTAREAHAVLVQTFDTIGATWVDSPIAGDSAPFMSTYGDAAAHYPHTLPEHAHTFDTIGAVRRYVESTGSHYFDRDAVRYFRGRTDGQIYGRRFWVESRRYVPGPYSDDTTVYPREYRVAWVEHGAGVASIARHGTYLTLDGARRGARQLAAAVTTLDSLHAEYPHWPGTLYDCAACQARCWCTDTRGEASDDDGCIYGADDSATVHHGTRAAREMFAQGGVFA